MRLKNFSLALTALTLLSCSGAFADCMNSCGTQVLSAPAVISAPACGTPVVLGGSETAYTDGAYAPMMLSQPAVVAAPVVRGPILGAPIRARARHTLFDLQLLGLDLFNFGFNGRNRCAAMSSYSAVVPSACAAPACTTLQSTCQPAVVEEPQPCTKTINLQDTTVTTTDTKWYRTHTARRVYKKCAARRPMKRCMPAPECGS